MSRSHYLVQASALAFAFSAMTFALPAHAQSADIERSRLADYVRTHPTDYDAAYRYVLLSSDARDYEAGIGALERMLMFNPRLSRARKELGFLYARLGAYQTASLHLREALESPTLDAVQRAQIEAQLPDIEKNLTASRWWGRFQVGLRGQSNANYFPSANLLQVGGVGFSSALGRRPDANAFEQAYIAHDYDFQNQRGDLWESRGMGYLTQQFSLDRYNVALFSGSTGPRLALAPDVFPGLTVKPYVTGTTAMLGNVNYLNSGGAGLSLRAMFGPNFSLEPGFEWRGIHVDERDLFSGGSIFSSVSTIATGDLVSGYLGGEWRASDYVRLQGRAAYTRANAHYAWQASDQVDVQGMVRFDVDPPFQIIPRRWTIAPYARFVALSFDAADPFVNPFVARRDWSWNYGVMLEAPITAQLGLAGHIDMARNESNLPNFRNKNLSVSFGPVAKF